MSHFRMMGPPIPLSGGMTDGATPSVLIACGGSAQRLESAQPRTLTRAVNISVVTGRADLHQHATATAVIEPVGRLLQRSHAPPQGTGQHPGRQGIKGLPNRLPKALRTEGPGSDANQTSRAFVFLFTFPAA